MVLPQAPPVDDIVNERYSDTVYRFLIWARYIRYSCPHVYAEQDIDTSISIQQYSDTLLPPHEGHMRATAEPPPSLPSCLCECPG